MALLQVRVGPVVCRPSPGKSCRVWEAGSGAKTITLGCDFTVNIYISDFGPEGNIYVYIL